MRAGRIILTYEALAKALGMDATTDIIAIAPQTGDDIANRRVSFVITGDDLPKHIEGTSLQIVTL